MYFIRHGQSEFNVHFAKSGRDPGIRDAPLTPHGRLQVESAARLLKNEGVTRILASPYTRALETANLIADVLDIKTIAIAPLLGERALYSCDVGTCISALRPRWPRADFSQMEEGDWWPPSGETQEEIERRVHAFLALENNDTLTRKTLAVSHWYFIFTLSGLDTDNADVVWRDDKGAFHKRF